MNLRALIILWLYTFLANGDCFKENLFSFYELGNIWTSLTSPEKFEDSHRLSIYLGYANNPFGPSTRVQNTSISEILSNLDVLKKISADNEAMFEHDNNNVADSGKHGTGGRLEQRSKRGVIHLYNMVSCATGCNPLIYKGYGCYCGFLGSGYAVDGIDRCCKMHDWCYDRAKCPMYLEYFVPYLWKCYHNTPLCGVKYGSSGQSLTGLCARRLCECDRILSECLRRYPCPSSRAVCRSSSWRLLQNALMIF